MIIGVDFDGTIVDHDFPRIGQPVHEALRWLRQFQKDGHKLVLWTIRSDSQKTGDVLTDAVEYLKSEGISLYGINENPQQKTWSKSPKAYCHVYIDDAALGCPLIYFEGFQRPCANWRIIGPAVLKLEGYRI
ncbi:MAG: hypothetical protein JSV82_02415 [Planctomycetota bacterium]|nr:MAG: hypothetical protein JSV82_02415 [Planctomycetota bacterium]